MLYEIVYNELIHSIKKIILKVKMLHKKDQIAYGSWPRAIFWGFFYNGYILEGFLEYSFLEG